MTKSNYLVNSAKLLIACCLILFAANTFVFLGFLGETVLFFGNKLSTFAFYIVLVLGFLAFNGEGISYKKSRNLKRKNHTRLLKALLIFSFLLRYIKMPFESVLLTTDATSFWGGFLRLFLGCFNTAASYGFLFTIVSLWYMKRDKKYKTLYIIELVSFIVGIVSNFYKMLNHTITKYSFAGFSDAFNSAFSNDTVLYVLVLLQFAMNIVMFTFVVKTYNKFLSSEHYEREQEHKKMYFARNIYDTDGFGVDTLEDDYLTEQTE